MKRGFSTQVFVAAFAVVAASADASWKTTCLGAGGNGYGAVYSVKDGYQAGYLRVGGVPRPTVWHDTYQSATIIDTVGFMGSVNAVDGSDKFGYRDHDPGEWIGAENSFIGLLPGSYYEGQVLGADDGLQCGYVKTGQFENDRACLWSGSIGSFVLLTHQTDAPSRATGCDSGVQVGWDFSSSRACIWYGTQASQVILNPAGWSYSRGLGIHQGHQVGWGQQSNATPIKAMLWSGTPESYVDLHPLGSLTSQALAVYQDVQVGFANWNGTDHAMFWQGTAASAIDLNQFLPQGYTTSIATSVWKSGAKIYVGGTAKDSRFVEVPFLWVYDSGPERVVPTSYSVNTGKVTGGSVASLADDDSLPLTVCKFVVANSSAPIVQFIVDGKTTNLTPSAISLKVKSKMVHSGQFVQTLEMANFQNFAYDVVQSGAIDLSYQTVDVTPPSPPVQYIGSAGLVRCRLTVHKTGVSAVGLPCSAWDVVNWSVTP